MLIHSFRAPADFVAFRPVTEQARTKLLIPWWAGGREGWGKREQEEGGRGGREGWREERDGGMEGAREITCKTKSLPPNLPWAIRNHLEVLKLCLVSILSQQQ